jgi:hypothetical protein
MIDKLWSPDYSSLILEVMNRYEMNNACKQEKT